MCLEVPGLSTKPSYSFTFPTFILRQSLAELLISPATFGAGVKLNASASQSAGIGLRFFMWS